MYTVLLEIYVFKTKKTCFYYLFLLFKSKVLQEKNTLLKRALLRIH